MIRRIFLATLAGFLLGLSFPWPSLWPLAWIALVPLFLSLYQAGARFGALLGALSGIAFFGQIYYWGKIFGIHVWITLTLFQSFYYALLGAALGWYFSEDVEENQEAYILFSALSWTVMEYLRSLGPMGVNWGALAYSQANFTPLIQISSFTGFYGVSFLVALHNGALAKAVMTAPAVAWFLEGKSSACPQRAVRVFVCVLAFVVLLAVAGIYLMPDSGNASVRIGLVQTNIEQGLKWEKSSLEMEVSLLEELTRDAASAGAQLVVWPETAIPERVLSRPDLYARVRFLAAANSIYLLVGAPDSSAEGRAYNTALLFSPKGDLLQRYEKIHLVPFGEYLPFEKNLRRFAVFERVQNFSPGHSWVVFHTPTVDFSAMICFESDFPAIARKNVKNGARLLAVLTNDAWFEMTSVAAHHFDWGIFRAVENRVSLVQAGNTGISGIVDPAGRVLAKSRLGDRCVVVRDVSAGGNGSFYTRYGDVFMALCCAGLILLGSRKIRRPRGRT